MATIQRGYSIIETATGDEVHAAGRLPYVASVPGLPKCRIGTFSTVGQELSRWKCVERHETQQPTPYHTKGTASVSFDGTKTVFNPGWKLPTVAALKQQRIGEVKQKSADIINSVYPDWKQRNMIAAGVQLLDSHRERTVWTPEEQALHDSLTAAWDWVASVRAHSDTLEAEIKALTKASDLAAWIEHDWPEAA